MAQHKPATSVTIAPLTEPSAFELFVKRSWPVFLAFALAVAAYLIWRQQTTGASLAKRGQAWDQLLAQSARGNFPDPAISGTPAQLKTAADAAQGTIAGPWARYAEVLSSIKARDYAGAKAALEKLRDEGGAAVLTKEVFDLGAGTPSTLVDYLARQIDAAQAWESKTPGLYANASLPEGSPRVRLKTDQGDIVVGLYKDAAPKHVENFLKLCNEGYYVGTKFHRVDPRFMIQGGDPNSREGAPETWGQGGPEEKIPFESNELYHFRGVLSMAKKPGDKDSSGSQFFITVAESHHLDGQHTVFGTVLEGMDVVIKIANGAIATGTSDRPQAPVAISAAELAGG